MKINSSYPQNVATNTNGADRSDGEFNRQKWLREMDNAYTNMVKDMRAVSGRDAGLASRDDRAASGRLPPDAAGHQSVVDDPRNVQHVRTDHTATAFSEEWRSQTLAPSDLGTLYGTKQTADAVKAVINLLGIAGDVTGDAESAAVISSGRDSANEAAWNTQNLHVEMSEEGAAVWMRNAALGQADEARIAAQLRRSLAGLGIRLYRLYLNGQLVGIESPVTE